MRIKIKGGGGDCIVLSCEILYEQPALIKRNLDTADKVYYIQYIEVLLLKEARAAEMLVMSGNDQDGLIFRAILLQHLPLPVPNDTKGKISLSA